MDHDNVNVAELSNVYAILGQFEEPYQTPNFDPVPLITRLAELVEVEMENYQKTDPDPLAAYNPNSSVGIMLEIIMNKDVFMQKLVGDFLRDNYWSRIGSSSRDSRELNTVSSRLLLGVIPPGLETSFINFCNDNEGLINRLFMRAERGSEPLQAYSTGLLAAAMKTEATATMYREKNTYLVPLMLKRLWEIQTKASLENASASENNRVPTLPFEPPEKIRKTSVKNKGWIVTDMKSSTHADAELLPGPSTSEKSKVTKARSQEECQSKINNNKRIKLSKPSDSLLNDSSNSSCWAEMEFNVIGTYQMHPLTDSTRQILILRYVTAMGAYEELLGHVIEHKALDLILNYISFNKTQDSRLSFEALKYLGTLLCHKKFSLEFIHNEGVERLLEIPRPSIAATGVSLCLDHLARCQDVMERVSHLPEHVLQELVRYGLWLLECSHQTGRCNAATFFSASFQYRILLKLFDAQDGLRRLYNVISTLSILSMDGRNGVSKDQQAVLAEKQTARHVCMALKHYFDTHLAWKVENLQRATQFDDTPAALSTLPYKAITPDENRDLIATAQDLMSSRANWAPVNDFIKLGGIQLFLQILTNPHTLSNISKPSYETIKSALDVLDVCTVALNVLHLLCEDVQVSHNASSKGMKILLEVASGQIVGDWEARKAALRVLMHCLCTPVQRSTDSASPANADIKCPSEDVLSRVWECVRKNDGLMVMIELVSIGTPTTGADSIRTLACKALLGLARSEDARQIMEKLQFFSDGRLQMLMMAPIHQGERKEHVKFQKHAIELIEKVSGRVISHVNEFEYCLARIHKADVVSRTRIQFNEKQLLQLIHDHLSSKNLTQVASLLMEQAGLAPPPPVKPVVENLTSYQTPACSSTPVSQINRQSRDDLLAIPTPPVATTTPPLGPIKLIFSNRRAARVRHNFSSPASQPSSSANQHRTSQEIPNWESTAITGNKQPSFPSSPEESSRSVTLESIVKEYLMNQHALCKNPMITCPEFDLFEPHKCPEAKSGNTAPANVVVRVQKRGIYPKFLNCPSGAKLDRRLIYSRFRPVRTFRNDEAVFTSCAFSPCEQFLMIGTQTGELKFYDRFTAAEEATYECHEGYLNNIQPNRSGDLLLTSGIFRPPFSCLWSVQDLFEMKCAFEDEEYVEFSKSVQDKIVGTKEETATIYDVATGKTVLKLTPISPNYYSKNRATFHPSDELILSDGFLWDSTSGKSIHKFDKLEQSLSGTFHPNGREMISSSAVWDIRSFRLLQSVPPLHQCKVSFSNNGDVIYAVPSVDDDEDDEPTCYSSFKTLDARDYSFIATTDAKRCVFELCTDKNDTQIAIIENMSKYDNSPGESIVRLYDVGRLRDDQDLGTDVEDEDFDGDSIDDDSDGGDESMSLDQEMEMLGELFGGRLRDGATDGEGIQEFDSDRETSNDSSSYFDSSDHSDDNEER